MYDSIKIGELLISKGANIDAQNIIYQIIKKSFLIILITIKGRNLFKKNWTALHYATINDLNKMGELLISKETDINAKDSIYQIIKNHF